MKQLTLEKLNRLSQNSNDSAEDSFQILSTSPPQTPEPSSKASKNAPQAPEPSSKASKGAPQAPEPSSKASSQSPFRQLRVLATVAQLKDDEIIFAALADPYAHPEFFKGILSKLNKLSCSGKLKANFG